MQSGNEPEVALAEGDEAGEDRVERDVGDHDGPEVGVDHGKEDRCPEHGNDGVGLGCQ